MSEQYVSEQPASKEETFVVPTISLKARVGVFAGTSLPLGLFFDVAHQGGIFGMFAAAAMAGVAVTVAPALSLYTKEPWENAKRIFNEKMYGSEVSDVQLQQVGIVEQQKEVETEKLSAYEPSMLDLYNELVAKDARLSRTHALIVEDDPKEILRLPARARQGKQVFSQMLRTFAPSLDQIYLATLEDGTAIYTTGKGLCHVALAGSTGGGKTSLIRLITCQLCKAGAKVLMLNPHYTHYDLENNEDWTPFEPYFLEDPMECRKYENIEFFLKQVATELLPMRLEKYANSKPLGKPYFLVLDELPAIVRHVPDAPEYLASILQEGRKVGIFLVTAAQDFLVKTIAPNGGGAIRECYRTAIYVGGDPTTAKTLLDMPANQIPENELGKGTVMLRNLTIKQAKLAHVPYVDNEALYALLGPSTYKPVPVPVVSEPDDEIYSFSVVNASPKPVVPTTPSLPIANEEQVPAIDEELERGIRAYIDDEATSINKLAAALEIKPYYAGPLLERVKKEVKKRQAACE